MKIQTLEEWQSEMKALFPKGPRTARFRCPRCELSTSIGDFIDAGLDPERAPQCCIGNYRPEVGCDWKAYGLLATLGKGRRLTTPDGGEIEVFEFDTSEVTAGG